MTATVEINNADWLKWRRKGVGASDVAGIMGMSTWASPWSVWADKVGLLPPREATKQQKRGQRMEAVIEPWFEEITGLKVHAAQTWLQHESDLIARATVDGMIVDSDDLAEFKTDGSHKKWDDIPVHYQVQGQWQLYVKGPKARRNHFAVMTGLDDLDVHVLERDETDIAVMVEQVHHFWHTHVITSNPPPVDGHDATYEALSAAYGEQVKGSELDIDELAHWVKVLRDSQERSSRLDKVITEAKCIIGEKLKTAEIGTIDGQKVVSWKTQSTGKRVDAKRLRADLPDIAKQYSTEGKTRVMRLHELKEA